MMPQTMPKTPRLVSNYLDMYEAFEDKDQLSRNEYRLILKYFNNLLRKSLINNAEIFNLPYSIGTMGISSAPTQSRVLDFQHYKETGEKRNVLNLNTEGRSLKILVKAKSNSLYFDMSTRCLFKFKASRRMARELASAIKNGQSVHNYSSYETYFN